MSISSILRNVIYVAVATSSFALAKPSQAQTIHLVPGQSLQDALNKVPDGGVSALAAGVIVDRNGGQRPDYGCPFVSLIEMNVETFPADQLPKDLAGIPAIKPGSK